MSVFILFTSLDGGHPAVAPGEGRTVDEQEGSADGEHQVISRPVDSAGQTGCLT